ncbi:Serine protease [Phytophthora cactorum]|nr:Serine protease [Phytophthora cactorum]
MPMTVHASATASESFGLTDLRMSEEYEGRKVGAFAATVASLSTFTYGYSFFDVSTAETERESTGLTMNEENRIWGGTDANIDKYPFLASLRDTFFEENFCAGTLIAPQYILTAGHCIRTDEMDIIATFGTNDSAGSGSGAAISVPVIEGFRHPLYKKKEHLYDVGLLKLKKPIKRKMAKLCAVDGSDNKVGTMGTVLGWGKTETSGELGSPVLQQLTLPVISNAECGKFKKYVGRVTEGMMCAGTGNDKDTCNGDSGGPLLVDGNILIGCVSWGSKCGEQAGIFTRLSYVMDYIEDILAGGDGSKFGVASSSGSLMEHQTSATKGKITKAPASEDDSTSGSDDLASLFNGSGSDDLSWLLKLLKSNSGSGKATKAPVKDSSESASEETDVPATKGKATKTPNDEDDSESGSDDLSWLLDSDSDSGSEDPTLVKGATKGKPTTAASGNHDLDWLFASESDSGSEDTVLVKGGKTTKATKASKASKTLIEDSASTSDSTSASEDSAYQSDSVHQSDQLQVPVDADPNLLSNIVGVDVKERRLFDVVHGLLQDQTEQAQRGTLAMQEASRCCARSWYNMELRGEGKSERRRSKSTGRSIEALPFGIGKETIMRLASALVKELFCIVDLDQVHELQESAREYGALLYALETAVQETTESGKNVEDTDELELEMRELCVDLVEVFCAGNTRSKKTMYPLAYNAMNFGGGAFERWIGDAREKGEHWRDIIEAVRQTHERPELVWRAPMRAELRQALQAEIETLERRRRCIAEDDSAQSGEQIPRWDHEMFYVEYPSMHDELVVNDYFVEYLIPRVADLSATYEIAEPVVLAWHLSDRLRTPSESFNQLCTSVTRTIVGVLADPVLLATFSGPLESEDEADQDSILHIAEPEDEAVSVVNERDALIRAGVSLLLTIARRGKFILRLVRPKRMYLCRLLAVETLDHVTITRLLFVLKQLALLDGNSDYNSSSGGVSSRLSSASSPSLQSSSTSSHSSSTTDSNWRSLTLVYVLLASCDPKGMGMCVAAAEFLKECCVLPPASRGAGGTKNTYPPNELTDLLNDALGFGGCGMERLLNSASAEVFADTFNASQKRAADVNWGRKQRVRLYRYLKHKYLGSESKTSWNNFVDGDTDHRYEDDDLFIGNIFLRSYIEGGGEFLSEWTPEMFNELINALFEELVQLGRRKSAYTTGTGNIGPLPSPSRQPSLIQSSSSGGPCAAESWEVQVLILKALARLIPSHGAEVKIKSEFYEALLAPLRRSMLSEVDQVRGILSLELFAAVISVPETRSVNTAACRLFLEEKGLSVIADALERMRTPAFQQILQTVEVFGPRRRSNSSNQNMARMLLYRLTDVLSIVASQQAPGIRAITKNPDVVTALIELASRQIITQYADIDAASVCLSCLGGLCHYDELRTLVINAGGLLSLLDTVAFCPAEELDKTATRESQGTDERSESDSSNTEDGQEEAAKVELPNGDTEISSEDNDKDTSGKETEGGEDIQRIPSRFFGAIRSAALVLRACLGPKNAPVPSLPTQVLYQLLTPSFVRVLRTSPDQFILELQTTEDISTATLIWTVSMRQRLQTCIATELAKVKAAATAKTWPRWNPEHFVAADSFRYQYPELADVLVLHDVYLANFVATPVEDLDLGDIDMAAFSEALLISIQSHENVLRILQERGSSDPTKETAIRLMRQALDKLVSKHPQHNLEVDASRDVPLSDGSPAVSPTSTPAFFSPQTLAAAEHSFAPTDDRDWDITRIERCSSSGIEDLTVLLMLLAWDLASLLVVCSFSLGGSAFTRLGWLLDVQQPQWRFWGLPVWATLIKSVLFLLATRWPDARPVTWLVNLFCLAFLGVLAVDAFKLDAISRLDEEKQALVDANVANSLPLIFTVLEVVNLSYLLDSIRTPAPTESEALPQVAADRPVEPAKPRGISFVKLMYILKPYFLPHGFANKLRAGSTYLVLILSKLANLAAPLFMASATNALVAKDTGGAIQDIAIFSFLTLVSKLFKELQSLIYLKVKQTAYIELATLTYEHVQSLSYDWHVQKKLGDVLRSMDRGVESANSVVSYVFLYLIPTLAESGVVIVIFAMHFELAGLSFVAFTTLVIYAYVTIKITLWRKKYREASMRHDNEYHDKATDALLNYETIKYFGNERHEVEEYSKVIEKYQCYSVSVQASLSVLNGTQAIIIQATVLAALALAAPHVVSEESGRRIDIGAFVAISVYLTNLFAPLFFLGGIYNMVINSVVDMKKLSELLSVEPDIVDSPDAVELGVCKYDSENGIDVAFRHVSFHYPSQPATTGVKDLNFTIPRGTTTALVGETGAGKTTISRLLFRFYECNAGKILVNHHNIATATQQSLRQAIGIVPQDTVLFNDTILRNIKYGNLNATFDQVVEAAKAARIYDFIMKLPDQWNTKVGSAD